MIAFRESLNTQINVQIYGNQVQTTFGKMLSKAALSINVQKKPHISKISTQKRSKF